MTSYAKAKQRQYHYATFIKNNKITDVRPLSTICEICGKRNGIQLCLDHCHTTNIFRGWLCTQCNSGIAMLGDNILGLKKAIIYLRNAYTHKNSEEEKQLSFQFFLQIRM
jgi:endonuclease IV